MQVSGEITNEFPLAPAKSADGIVQGIDGNFYFTDPTGSNIGQFILSSNVVKTFPTKTPNAKPTALAVGYEAAPFEALYFTEANVNQIGKFSY